MPNLIERQQARQLVKAIAQVRAAVALACLVFPSLARGWVGPGGATPAARVLSRSLAARDLALGLGTAQAKEGTLRRWAFVSAVGDATDAIGTILCHGSLPKARRLAVTATSAAAARAGLVAAAALPPSD